MRVPFPHDSRKKCARDSARTGMRSVILSWCRSCDSEITISTEWRCVRPRFAVDTFHFVDSAKSSTSDGTKHAESLGKDLSLFQTETHLGLTLSPLETWS